MEAEQHPEWGDISDWGPSYKSYWAQWKPLAVRDSVLERHWQSANRKKKMAQRVISHSDVKEVLAEMHMGTHRGYLGTNKTIDKVQQRYYRLHLRGDVERWCQQCDICATSQGTRPRSQGLMHQYEVGAPFKRIAKDIAGPLPESNSGNISPDPHGLLHQMVRNLRHTQPRHINGDRCPVINFFYHFGIPMELNSNQGHNFEYKLMQEVLERLGVRKTRQHTHTRSQVEWWNVM
jgi:hypothetical protein